MSLGSFCPGMAVLTTAFDLQPAATTKANPEMHWDPPCSHLQECGTHFGSHASDQTTFLGSKYTECINQHNQNKPAAAGTIKYSMMSFRFSA